MLLLTCNLWLQISKRAQNLTGECVLFGSYTVTDWKP